MLVLNLLIYSLIILVNSAIILATNDTCVDSFQDANKTTILNYEEYCGDSSCIQKCCPGATNRIIFITVNEKGKPNTKCLEIEEIQKLTKTNNTIDYSLIPVYKNNYGKYKERSNKNLNHDFRFVFNKKLNNPKCSTSVTSKYLENYLILENGSLVVEKPNFYNRFPKTFESNEYCIERVVKVHTSEKKSNIVESYYFIRYLKMKDEESNNGENLFKSIAMGLSCVFLLLVLVVYALLPDLRNFAGKLQMAYCGTHFLAFLFKFIQLTWISKLTEDQCKRMSVVLYYFTLSIFFWMNIMSLDLWWTFRGYYKSRRIHRRGENVKFCWYGLFAWGVPLLVTVAVAVIDFIDLKHFPWIYQPHFELCFLIRGSVMEIRHYLFMPILALLLVNVFFFLLTTFNIWRIKKNMPDSKNAASKYNKNQSRFTVYIRLSLLMGVSWIFSVIDNLPYFIELAATIYNGLVGVAIFLIFVCNTKILLALCDKFSITSPHLDRFRRKSSAAPVSQSQIKRRNTTVSEISSVN